MKRTFKKLRSAIAVILVFLMISVCIPATASAESLAEPIVENVTGISDVMQNVFNALHNFILSIFDFFKNLFNFNKQPAAPVEPDAPAAPVLVETIKVDADTQKLVAGDEAKIAVTVTPDDATNKNVVFASADETVATVDKDGNITAVAAGKTTITVTSADSGAACATVTVNVYDGAISSYEEFKDSFKTKSGSFMLDEDITAADSLFFGSATNVFLDMNGKTLNAEKKTQYIFCSQTNDNGPGSLYITGDGIVNAGLGFYVNKTDSVATVDNGTYITDTTKTLDKKNVHSVIQKESKMIINGGTFISPVENTVLFYVIYGSTLEINGGFFENTADKTPELMIAAANPEYSNQIHLKGGTFVNWNPCNASNFYAADSDELPFGPYIILCDGYTVVAEEQENGDIWYSVVPVAE